jgi:hypothetical protein
MKMRMTDRSGLSWLVGFALVGACDAKVPADRSTAATQLSPPRPAAEKNDRATAAQPVRADAGRYTSIDPASCRLIEQNIEEGGYSRHACDGLAGYRLEISESDLRQDIVVIAPDGRRSELGLSDIVAKGAFNSLGKTAEWRGAASRPTALIVRLNVARGPEPTQPDISNLVVARLAPQPCVVAVTPPGPGQNAAARQRADGDLPACIEESR